MKLKDSAIRAFTVSIRVCKRIALTEVCGADNFTRLRERWLQIGASAAIICRPLTNNSWRYAMGEVDNCKAMCSRENTTSMLRRRARQMHEQASRFERIADMCEHMRPEDEAAMYELVSAVR